MAFEEFGFCVVRGPDILLGGDVCKFKAIEGKFDGIIGGPPCKPFSQAIYRVGGAQFAVSGNLVPEFERIVSEAKPKWFVMENVPGSPIPKGAVWSQILEAHDFGASQKRKRRFSSNWYLGPEPVTVKHEDPLPTVVATEHKYFGSPRDTARAGRHYGRRLTIEEVNVAMGLPQDFETPALTLAKSYEVRGNGVPLQMGRAIAKAIDSLIK